MNWVSVGYILGGSEGDSLDAFDRLHAHFRNRLLELLLSLGSLVVLVAIGALSTFVVVFVVIFVVVIVVAVLVVLVFSFGGHDSLSLQY